MAVSRQTPSRGTGLRIVGQGSGEAPERAAPQTPAAVWRQRPEGAVRERDLVATEEPLEIRLRSGDSVRTIAVTMRTPGHDEELAAGFLFAEGIVEHPDELLGIGPCTDPEERGPDGGDPENIVVAELAGEVLPDLAPLERHFFATSACGVCGKAGIESLTLRGVAAPGSGPEVGPEVLASLPDRLRAAQGVFEATGGLHAAALFEPDGSLVAVREDVGRHNALDKLLGRAFLDRRTPLGESVVLVSGRASFEILQKALAAGVPFVCAVSAPSSLAVDLARRFGVTLVGFLRGDRFNVYAGDHRVAGLGSGT